MEYTIRLSLPELAELAESRLMRYGVSAGHARAMSAVLVAGERDGCASHGVIRLLDCVHTIRTGRVVRDAEPALTRAAPGVLRVNAGGGFAPLALELGLPELARCAREYGVAVLAVNHCVHFSALWPEVEFLVDAGLVAFATTASHAWVVPAGGRTPVLGTNPIAFGWPRPTDDPFVFDFATSVVARGEIEMYRRAGRQVPEGWGVDRSGAETTDPAEILRGAMHTFGGHKGTALATMVELLAGPLIGDLTSVESLVEDDGAGGLPLGGEFLIALDPAGILGTAVADCLERAEHLFVGLEASGARLPSRRRYANRARSIAAGVVIDPKVYEEILAL